MDQGSTTGQDEPQDATRASESVSKVKDDETTKETKKATEQPNKRHWWQRMFID